jgi:hypothetical protein
LLLFRYEIANFPPRVNSAWFLPTSTTGTYSLTIAIQIDEGEWSGRHQVMACTTAAALFTVATEARPDPTLLPIRNDPARNFPP